MGRRIFFINLLILAVLLVLAQQLVVRWQGFDAGKRLQALSSPAGAARVEAAPPQPEQGQSATLADFLVIAERDLFSPERRLEAGESEENAPKAPEFPKKPQMNGVSETDGVRKALLTTFDTPNGAGESRMVTVGDMVQGYTVSEISDTALTLKWNDHVEVIDMLSSERSRPPQAAAPARAMAAVNIIRVGTKVAAVETVASSNAEEADRRGVQVGTAGTQVQRTGARGLGALPAQPGGGAANVGAAGQNQPQRTLPANVNLPDRPSNRRPPGNQ